MQIQAPGHSCRYLTAQDTPEPERVEGEPSLCRFSDAYLHSLYAEARSDLRSKSRGVVLLTSLVRQLPALDSASGVYLYGGFGPYSSRAQSAGLSAPAGGRVAAIEKALPPKDYFIATPAMKAAQLSIDFQLHGPLMTLFSPDYGFAQACRLAQTDLIDGVVPAALVAGIFTLEGGCRQPALGPLVEAVWVNYATHPDQIFIPQGPSGRFGPLTSSIERSPVHEQ